jgi:hypothetical protein
VKKSVSVTRKSARRAQAVGDEKLRADYSWLEKAWLKFSYEVRQRLTLFTNETA